MASVDLKGGIKLFENQVFVLRRLRGSGKGGAALEGKDPDGPGQGGAAPKGKDAEEGNICDNAAEENESRSIVHITRL